MRAEHDRAVFASLSGSNMDKHALRVDVADSQRANFGDSQSRSIRGGDNGFMLDGSNLLENPDDLLLGEDHGESFVCFWPGDLIDLVWCFKRGPVQEFNTGHMHSQVRGGDFALLFEMEEKSSDIFLRQLLRRSMMVFCKVAAAWNVSVDRVSAVVFGNQV